MAGEIGKQMRIKTLHIEFTTACNSRCVMCDYWKTAAAEMIDPKLVLSMIAEQYPLGLETVYFTGGECLLFAESVFSLCTQIRESFPGLRLGLITNGLLLEKYCREIAGLFQKVIVSFDAVDPVRYKKIRGVDGAETIQKGIRSLKEHSPQTQVNLRVLVLEENLDELPEIVEYGLTQKLNRVSFIPEDTSSQYAFGRRDQAGVSGRKPPSLAELRRVIDQIKTHYSAQMGTLLRPELEDLERVYSIYSGAPVCFPACNKASFSCVISSGGLVSPCFFINGTQKISSGVSLQRILTSDEYLLRVREINAHFYPICGKCACPKELS
ncbi:MAG: radical SAM protein [Candidatus Limivicinus sp.]|nr:radical SAM protein [Candidatus Limivicinus sp.]